jgi:hypothetical protein
MFGPPEEDSKYASELRGIIPRSAEYLFDELQRSEDVQQVKGRR